MTDIRPALAPVKTSLWKPLLLAGLAMLLILFGLSLGRDSSVLPSALIGKQAPAFTLARLDGGAPIRFGGPTGKPAIVNFWASWCGACRMEHEVLIELGRDMAKSGVVEVLGVNYRDTVAEARRFLAEHGTFPFPSAVDADGRTGIDFGVYGLPETFFVAADGTVAVRHVGPLSREDAEAYLRKMGVRP